MNVIKKKLKKQSDASSKPPHKNFTFFLDRNFGNFKIVEALRDSGYQVEIHDDHLDTKAPDEEWIKFVSKRGWLAITKDKRIKYRASEIYAIREYGARVLVVRAKNTTGEDVAAILLKSYHRIQRFAAKTKPPFIAGIDRSGKITLYDILVSPSLHHNYYLGIERPIYTAV